MRWVMAISSLDASDGGPPQAVLGLARALRELGHEVVIVTHRHDGVAVNDLVPAVLASGVEIVWVQRKRATRFQLSPGLLRALLRQARATDVVAAHSFYQFTCVAAFLGARRGRARLWVQPHGVFEPYQEQVSRRVKAIFRLVVGRAVLNATTTLVATAESEAQGIRRSLGPSAAPILVAGLGVDAVARSADDDSTRWASRRVLFLSRIASKKRLDKLIDALATLRERGRPAHLTVCGDGDPDVVARLRARAAGVGLPVEWAGHVTGDVRHLLEANHALMCLPSDNENFGQAVTEAMAAGLPVVTTRATGASEHVQRASAGWVADDPTVEELADLLDVALDDPRGLAEMSRRGRAYAARELTWRPVAERWADRARAEA